MNAEAIKEVDEGKVHIGKFRLGKPLFANSWEYSIWASILKHDIKLVTSQLIALNQQGGQRDNAEGPPEVEGCRTLYYIRTHPQEATPTSAPIATLPPLAAPQQAQVSESGAQQGLNAPASTQQLGDLRQRPRPLFASANIDAADLGARRARSAPAQTQLAALDGRLLRADARMTDLGGRRQFYALAPSQLDQRQAPSVSAYVQVGDMGARRAHSAPVQTQLATVDRRQAFSAPQRMQVADLSARRPLSAARHHVGRTHQYAQNTAVATRPAKVKARMVAAGDNGPSNRKSAIASML